MYSSPLQTFAFNLSSFDRLWRYRLLASMLVLALALFGISSTARAVNPAPDGGYPNRNTAEGADALLLTTGAQNTGIGFEALVFNTTGYNNTATGAAALSNNETGIYNTATGSEALILNTTGSYNTANGESALYRNNTGNGNTANGAFALLMNKADNNTATGAYALEINSYGTQNTANGAQALLNNSTGTQNTAVGAQALLNNSTGQYNTASGASALFHNTTGANNTANGAGGLFSNTTGYNNTANGGALAFNTTGFDNTASGFNALENNTTGHDNTAEGFEAFANNKTGSNNIALGSKAGLNLTTGSNNIIIGAGVLGIAGEANTIRIGKSTQTATYITGIYSKGVASATGVPVKIDSTGKLGTVLSSARYKDNIKPMDKASEAILRLEPVTFRYKQELDPDGVAQFGLIAEQVEKIDPNLVVRDEDGKVSTVRYEAVNAMLLNEFLKEHQKVAEQQQAIEMLKQRVASNIARASKQETMITAQQKRIEALAAGLERVSARVKASQSSTKLVIAK